MPARTTVLAICVALWLALTGVAGAEPAELRWTELDSPAADGSAMPYLDGTPGAVWLSWFERGSGGTAVLKCARRSGDVWGPPRVVASGRSFFVNWADFPSVLALPDGALATHWLEKCGPGTFDYHVQVSLTRDEGASWAPPARAHADDSRSEHGFVSLVDRGGGAFTAVWLDGREMAPEAEGEKGSMTLRAATFRDGGFRDETELDPRTCECCQTAAAVVPGGVFVAYRDRAEDETRDISYVREEAGRWTAPRTLHADGWKTAGCPVNGPQAAAKGDRMAVAWPTSAGGGAKVLVCFSADGGRTFRDPVRVDRGNPIGRVDVEWGWDDASAIVVWIESSDAGGEILARRVRADGGVDEPARVAAISAARASGFPRLARSGPFLYIVWTDVGPPSRVRVARAGG